MFADDTNLFYFHKDKHKNHAMLVVGLKLINYH